MQSPEDLENTPFTEGKGDGIESRLPFKIFSTLTIFIKIKVEIPQGMY